MAKTTIVVPCYDEADRLPSARFLDYAASDAGREVDFVLVNDGSRDATLAVLNDLAARAPAHFHVIDVQPNRGKAEAVRLGMQAAMSSGATFVGYFDADLATPLSEIARLREILEASSDCEIVLGSRVQLLGRTISRSPLRHYLGRVFATCASVALGLPVYDTQCGAKLLRTTPATRALFAEPFLTSWVFDVELIARMIAWRRDHAGPPLERAIVECPLLEWHDVAGSKVRPIDFLRAILELCRIRRRYGSARAAQPGRP